MQRVQKQGGESENAQRTAQARFTSKSRENEQANGIDGSPAMIAQRKRLNSLFGGAIQRVEDEEPLQGKFETAQRVEEEEPLQGKFETAQRVEEEEPLQGKFETAQRVEEEEPLQGKFEGVQRVEEEEPLQGKFEAASSTQLKEEVAKPNNTGLPDNLKSGIESLSGMSMDSVKVHYNSSHPAQLNALAYAQGTDIHVAPGQEQHLPHEAWHVVQQAQGRVKPTMQMKEGVPVNDDAGLEHEADVMGARAASAGVVQGKSIESDPIDTHGGGEAIQRRRVHPQDSTGTALVRSGGTATTDDQAPQTVSQYNLVLAQAAANRNTAINNIRAEYTAFGHSLGNGADSFISRGTINTWRSALASQGAAIYDRYIAANVALTPPVAPVTDQKKSNAVNAYGAWRTPAVMDHLLNWGALPLMDPLKVTVTSPINGGGSVIATIEFTEAHRGYISHVNALGSNAPMARVAKYGDGTGGTRDGTSTVAALDSYSLTHHSASNTTADQQMNAAAAGGSSLAEKEEGVDALTKVVAEGGRFNCVAALGSAITNDTKFYTQDGLEPLAVTYRYIDFKTLWTKWTAGFGKAYGISNDAVRDYINDERDGVVTVSDEPAQPHMKLV